MKTKFTFSKTFLVFAIALMLAAGELWSQQFIMQTEGAQYNASCSGVIKIKSNCDPTTTPIDNAFVNTDDANTLGTATNPIPGIVDWASEEDDQIVQVLYYTSLVVSGGTKTIPSGVVVTGKGDCSTLLAGYTDLTGYPFAIITGTDDVTFTGDFTYESGGSVNIFPVDENNNYDNLVIAGTGPATILGGEEGDKVVTNTINSSKDDEGNYVTTPLVVGGDLIITGGDNNASSNLGGEVTISEGGSITTGTGSVNFGDDLAINGSLTLPDFTIPSGGTNGTVTLEGTTTIGEHGSIELENNTDLVISGEITNGGNGTNLDFDCGSTVTYNGSSSDNPDYVQIIMPTLNSEGNRYGNLILTGGPKVGGVVTTYVSGNYADIYTCGDFSLAGGNLDMASNTGVLFLTKTDAVVTYGDGNGNEEVMGKFGRAIGEYADAKEYTFNNRYTSVTLANDENNPKSFQFNVQPGTAPNNYESASDVNRKITVNYTGNIGEFDMAIQAGYLESEKANWDSPYSHTSLRFYEADGTDVEKVGTGQEYGRGSATGDNLGYVSLAGIGSTTDGIGSGTNDIAQFMSGNDLLLRSGRTTFYSINDGRWTNPATWDEGTVPTSIDNVEIRDMVYVGIKGSFAGTGEDGNQTPEHSHYGGDGAAANTITIAQKKAVDGSPFPSLIIGNEDNPADYVFKTAAAGTSFTNLNTNSPSLVFPLEDAKNTITSSNVFNGLWLISLTQDSRIPAFGTSQIENSGTINNEGIIELGNCE